MNSNKPEHEFDAQLRGQMQQNQSAPFPLDYDKITAVKPKRHFHLLPKVLSATAAVLCVAGVLSVALLTNGFGLRTSPASGSSDTESTVPIPRPEITNIWFFDSNKLFGENGMPLYSMVGHDGCESPYVNLDTGEIHCLQHEIFEAVKDRLPQFKKPGDIYAAIKMTGSPAAYFSEWPEEGTERQSYMYYFADKKVLPMPKGDFFFDGFSADMTKIIMPGVMIEKDASLFGNTYRNFTLHDLPAGTKADITLNEKSELLAYGIGGAEFSPKESYILYQTHWWPGFPLEVSDKDVISIPTGTASQTESGAPDGTNSKTVLYNVKTKESTLISSSSDFLRTTNFSQDERYLFYKRAYGTNERFEDNRAVYRRDLSTGETKKIFECEKAFSQIVAVSHNGQRLVVEDGLDNAVMKVISKDGELLITLTNVYACIADAESRNLYYYCQGDDHIKGLSFDTGELFTVPLPADMAAELIKESTAEYNGYLGIHLSDDGTKMTLMLQKAD